MTWLLVIILATGTRYGGNAITFQEFTTKERCVQARLLVLDKTKAQPDSATCIER